MDQAEALARTLNDRERLAQVRVRQAQGLWNGHVHPAANPLAWLLWHIARSEDASVNLLVAAGPQVLDDAWARRLKVARRDIGEGMTMAEVDQLCETIDLGALPAYWAAVGERTAPVMSALACAG